LSLAKAFNRVYNDVPFLREKDDSKRSFRLFLASKTAEIIQDALSLLGIDCPERM
jgi:arginyl-tRNA synthetase